MPIVSEGESHDRPTHINTDISEAAVSNRQKEQRKRKPENFLHSSARPFHSNYSNFGEESGRSSHSSRQTRQRRDTSRHWSFSGATSSILEGEDSVPRNHSFSDGYEFRHTTRRQRSLHSADNLNSAGCPMQPSSVHLPSDLTEDRGRKSESPSRKRRRMSQGLVATSPSPPLVRPWQTVNNQEPLGRMAATQHHPHVDLCNNVGRRPVSRTSSIRRHSQRQRERQLRNWNSGQNVGNQSQSPVTDRRAFQPPPNNMAQQGHLGHGPTNSMTFPHPLIIDMNNEVPVPTTAPFSLPVSVPTYAVPLCTGHTTIPPCATHHNPFNPSLPLGAGQPHPATHNGNSIPVCSMGHLPLCSMHLPACSVQHVAMRQQTLPTMFHQEAMLGHIHHGPPAHHPQHHMIGPHGPYLPAAPPAQSRNPEMEMIHDRSHPAFHVPSNTHPTAIFSNSPPLHVIQDSYIRTAPRDLSHMQTYQRLNAYARQRRTSIPQWRTPLGHTATTLHPSYPGVFLRYIVPTAPVNSGLQMELDADPVEENYEALLNLAEQLGEAKPRGLSKAIIDQLPSYRYNPETHQSINDQTCCVVCMSDFENRQLLRVLPCSHEFHARCVDKWLKTNRTCPICRADASEINNQSS